MKLNQLKPIYLAGCMAIVNVVYLTRYLMSAYLGPDLLVTFTDESKIINHWEAFWLFLTRKRANHIT